MAAPACRVGPPSVAFAAPDHTPEENGMANPQASGRATSVGDDLDQLKQDFVTAFRILVNEGVTQDAFNVSCRISGDRMLVHSVVSPTMVTPDNLEIYPVAEGPKTYRAHPAIY